MAIQHPVFLRPAGTDKLMVITIIDIKEIPVTTDSFIIATTDKNVEGSPTITFNMHTCLTSKEYVEIINRSDPYRGAENTIGMGPGGILTGAYWFIRQIQTIMSLYF